MKFVKGRKAVIASIICAILIGCATAAKVLIQSPMFKVEVECNFEDTACVTNVTVDDQFWVCDFKVHRDAISMEMLRKFCKQKK